MDSKEARRLTDLSTIEKTLVASALDGNSYANIRISTCNENEIVDRLEKLGYEVTQEDFREGVSNHIFRVSW